MEPLRKFQSDRGLRDRRMQETCVPRHEATGTLPTPGVSHPITYSGCLRELVNHG
jgi:hypothetical protein